MMMTTTTRDAALALALPTLRITLRKLLRTGEGHEELARLIRAALILDMEPADICSAARTPGDKALLRDMVAYEAMHRGFTLKGRRAEEKV